MTADMGLFFTQFTAFLSSLLSIPVIQQFVYLLFGVVVFYIPIKFIKSFRR